MNEPRNPSKSSAQSQARNQADTPANSPEGRTRGAISDESRHRMLRLVTKSFCREIVDYGVDVRDLLKVSGHVLEFASVQTERPPTAAIEAFRRFALNEVATDGATYRMGPTSLRPLAEDDLAHVVRWVARDDVQNSTLVPYPTHEDELRQHMASPTCSYHVIAHDGRPAGLIGAEDIDGHSRRAEMRKFIGEPDMRGRGLGTEATFLWLHHAFGKLGLHKVYIHTHHGNARNLKLNRSLGFEVEGVLSEEHRMGGSFVDIVRMGLLEGSWQELMGGPGSTDSLR